MSRAGVVLLKDWVVNDRSSHLITRTSYQAYGIGTSDRSHLLVFTCETTVWHKGIGFAKCVSKFPREISRFLRNGQRGAQLMIMRLLMLILVLSFLVITGTLVSAMDTTF